LSSFIAEFKSAVTIKFDDFIDENNLPIEKFNRKNKLWQPNYHDHIIRNEDEYWRIKNYIKNNPENWTNDKFHQ
jgi:REP element-mobilizing transposase RayT